MSAFDQFWTDLKAPLVPNSPMIKPTSGNAVTAMPFVTPPNPQAPAPAPAPGANKWMVISLIGAACFGLYYMAGGFGGGSAIAAPARTSRRRRSTRRRASAPRRRKSRNRRSRGKVTWDW